jgi:3-oxoacyl-[acyl-carrier-protein] synthase II
MPSAVVITGVGMVTPFGKEPPEILRRIEAGDSAAAPSGFGPDAFACPVCARVEGFQPQDYVSEVRLVRLMNRDAQLAVAAAHLALQDARVKAGVDYPPEEIALYGATGLAGLPLGEVLPLVKASAGADGGFDLARFGRVGLRAVSPILSFKILSNMPICFVSICEDIQGPNAIYTPWEGQGAQAIAAGVRALQSGDARCALVGGCDVKTHELAFLSLEEQGIFGSWNEAGNRAVQSSSFSSLSSCSIPAAARLRLRGRRGGGEEAEATASADGPGGVVPGEGAAFLVLETEANALQRGARIYAKLIGSSEVSRCKGQSRTDTLTRVLRGLTITPSSESGGGNGQACFDAMVGSGNGDFVAETEETVALAALRIAARAVLHPKKHIGELFAAAAPVQVGLAALLAQRGNRSVLANCFGHGTEQAAFVVEKP